MLHEATRRDQIDHELLRRYHEHGDTFARDELAVRCAPLVKSLVRRYNNSGEEVDDLIQAGVVGLVKAIDRFDLRAGTRFISFAVPNITGEIRRHFRDHTWAVHVPRSLQELDAKVVGARRMIIAETGREPTDDDLAVELQVDVSEIREARAANRAYRAMSLETPTGEGRTIADTRGVHDGGYDQVDAELTLGVALEALSDRDRKVIDLRYRDGLLQREIAVQVGCSQMQVSRIISNAINTMGHHVGATEPAPLAA
ncbi:SigB/SigF/SigG family RNA polymerase sigma factor [Patulibacter minatonensis]|uniref:SigB/SigF/SigG family RNA polymerase sigma factor n=1 Tax=Patulibacter minatonensis TaxID=298163 RepID=UPI0004AC929F|nr:SigB/SigF/SigG family RNA polymerase sigma factor [Patulibacter minatonensis]